MGFLEMDQELLAKLLSEFEVEGGTDVLAEDRSNLDKLYSSTRCPQCGGSCRAEYDARTAYTDPNYLVAKATLRCRDCGCHFDPHTGLRIAQGNLGKIPVPHVIVKPSKE